MTHYSVDANSTEIVSALHDAHMTVAHLDMVGGGVPDKVICGVMPCPCGSGRKVRQNKLAELKTPTGNLRKAQKDFHHWWKGEIVVVRSVEDALRMVGLLK